ncbi:MAG: folylpolyglutamate synthase/dihydrofolate synthase family protein [Pirellulaceae bacterium]
MAQAPGSNEYGDAIEYLYRRINYELTPASHPRRKINLENMRLLLAELGNPQSRIPAIHIAGTKGKGSTAAMVSSILCQAGLRTGLYTSPHLDFLEERYRIGGIPCTPAQLVALTHAVQPAVAAVERQLADRPGVRGLTFFEVTTAMAWLHFMQQQVEVAVIEVGLGGRLDSTNLCAPHVTVITSISFDHTQQLGHTLAAIAREKAGIIKAGVPVISGVTAPEPREVIEAIAWQQGAPLFTLGEQFHARELPLPREPERLPQPARLDYAEHTPAGHPQLAEVPVGLIGSHQIANAAVALATAFRLRERGWVISPEAMRQGLARVHCDARIEVIGHQPTVILDTAHNVASIAALVHTLQQWFSPTHRLYIFAASRDKDVPGMLRYLLPAADTVVFTAFQNNPRAVPPETLLAQARDLVDPSGAPGTPLLLAAAIPAAAWQLARLHARTDGLVCITGSFFLAAEMRPLATSRG